VVTTVGRCIFNDILPTEMPFYNYPLWQKGSRARDRGLPRSVLGRGDD
jgi:hypothetical protein